MSKAASPIRPAFGTVLRLMTGLLLTLSLTGGSLAEETTLPQAEKVLAQFVEATGGQAAYDQVKNRSSKITLEIPGAGVKADMTLIQARPNRMYTALESPAFGKIESGTDGEIAWETSTSEGARIKTGQEREDALREAFLDRLAHWKEIFEKAECTGLEEVNGSPAYRVVLTPKTGNPSTLFFDRQSHLLVKARMTVDSQEGSFPIESYPSNYQKTGALLLPRSIRVLIGSQERMMTVQSVQNNLELPPETFRLPAAVKELLKAP